MLKCCAIWVGGGEGMTNPPKPIWNFVGSSLSAIWCPSNHFGFLKCWSVTKLKFDGCFCVKGVWNDGKLLYPCVCRVVSENMNFWTFLSFVICMMFLTIFALKNFVRGWTIWRTLLATCTICKMPILVSWVGVCVWNPNSKCHLVCHYIFYCRCMWWDPYCRSIFNCKKNEFVNEYHEGDMVRYVSVTDNTRKVKEVI